MLKPKSLATYTVIFHKYPYIYQVPENAKSRAFSKKIRDARLFCMVAQIGCAVFVQINVLDLRYGITWENILLHSGVEAMSYSRVDVGFLVVEHMLGVEEGGLGVWVDDHKRACRSVPAEFVGG